MALHVQRESGDIEGTPNREATGVGGMREARARSEHVLPLAGGVLYAGHF